MKQRIIDLLIEILTPVIQAAVKTAIEEARGECITVKNNTIHEVASIPSALACAVHNLLNPFNFKLVP